MKRNREDRQKFNEKARQKKEFLNSPEVYKNRFLNTKGRKKFDPKRCLDDIED